MTTVDLQSRQALGNLVDVVLFLALDALAQWQLFDIFCGIMLVASAYFIHHIRGCVSHQC